MEYERDIKNRRKKRIQSLLEEQTEAGSAPALFTLPDNTIPFREWGRLPEMNSLLQRNLILR